MRGPPSRGGSAASAGSIRSFASALLVWLLTVPGETPSSRAVSASLRSSTKRSTITARCRRGSRPIAVQRSWRWSAVVVPARARVGLGRLGVRLLAVPLPPPPRRERVDQDLADVGLGVALDPRPGEPRLGQRGLQQVLGEGVVAGEQVRRTQQPGRAGGDELVEVHGRVSPSPPEICRSMRPVRASIPCPTGWATRMVAPDILGSLSR